MPRCPSMREACKGTVSAMKRNECAVRESDARCNSFHARNASGNNYSFRACAAISISMEADVIRKLKTGEYRLYSVKKDAQTGRRRNLGTFNSLAAAKQHERDVQYFKHR